LGTKVISPTLPKRSVYYNAVVVVVDEEVGDLVEDSAVLESHVDAVSVEAAEVAEVAKRVDRAPPPAGAITPSLNGLIDWLVLIG
jgi:hypothetical protein